MPTSNVWRIHCAVLLITVATAGFTSGCAAVKATRQPSKRDLAVLEPGVSGRA